MQIKNVEKKTLFSGNVVEIFNNENGTNVKFLLKPAYVSVELDSAEELHLGDQLNLICKFRILKIDPSFGKINEGS